MIRYDCAHGYAHCDRFNVHGQQRKDDLKMSFAKALTFADDDIDDRWEIYWQNFLKGGFP